ncbi:tetratricopeptide repeat protein [Microseira sp. BLCC-F43]|uniref:CHAT domain-containing protein n=1 Tax=Microseira sp. BLCC-F43 TaxID=3153602 RepID=UPI0035B7FAB6
MRLPKIGFAVLIVLVATVVEMPPSLNLKANWGVPKVLAQTTAQRKAQADRLLEQGIQQYETSQFRAALQSLQQALAIYLEIKDRQGEGNALRILGLAYDSLGDYQKAIEYQQQSLAIARQISDRQAEGLSLGNLGLAYNSLGDYQKAIEYHQQSLAITREIGHRQAEGRSLGNLGNAYDSLGDYQKAIEYYQQSLAITREIGDRLWEGNALGNLGNAYRSLGDYQKAIEYQQQSLAITQEIGDRLGEGATLGSLGVAYFSLGDYQKAIDYQQQSLAIAREIGDRRGEGQSLVNLGSAYRSLGDYQKAIEYQQQSLAITREIGDRFGEGAALGSLSNAYNLLGDYQKAIEYQQRSLAIAREISDRLGEGQSLGNLGLAYHSLGDYQKAIEYHQQRLAIAREIGDPQSEGLALNNLGLALHKQGNLTAAEKTLFEGIEVWESLREKLGSNDTNKVSIFEEQARTYRILQEVLIAQNKTDKALEVAERGRARAFVELLARRLSANPAETLPANLLKPTLEQIKQIAKIQNATLVQYSIISDSFKIQGKQQSQESELYIWVIKPTGEVAFRQANLKPLWQDKDISLARLVSLSRQSIGVGTRTTVANAANVETRATLEIVLKPGADQTERLQQLHQIIIEPIADLLPTAPNARVIFIPQSSLFLVPFPALKDKSGKYLIEKHTILTAPSLQVLELTRQQRERIGKGVNNKQALILGNPIMPSVPPAPGEPPQQLRPLPGAEREANAIASLLNAQPLTGSLGTKAAIVQKMPSARIIHLATHGIFDDIRGLGSAIALAPSGNDNGLLTAEEILDLKLNAELVVLSACDTGRGRITGDGIIGLSRSFINAGVPSVMVSLWAVPDAPTAELMKAFYQNWQKNPDKAQALRQAMLTMMQQYPHPKDWAAFTLIGEVE